MQLWDGLGNERGEDYRNGIGHCYQYLVLNACSYLNRSYSNTGICHELVEVVNKAGDKNVFSVMEFLDALWRMRSYDIKPRVRLLGQDEWEDVIDEVNGCVLVL